eukprot:TRINITY_DN8017_c0_g1_i1.p1 TRINITY_DN8017_c0_g1~~TRINITY_DN8017_c0_g1_i1.p1  ORF type:complete len:344 (-),score=164.01 TRINITY_DN8017_c0_g1_i1:278-1309(-)
MAPKGTKRKNPEESAAAAKCQKIQKALDGALLKGMAKVALMTFKEERHAYTNEIVEEVGKALDTLAGKKSEAIETMQASIKDAPAQKQVRASALKDAEAKLADLTSQVAAKKAEQKSAKEATEEAHKALKQAKDTEKKDNKEVNALETAKAELQGAMALLEQSDKKVLRVVKDVKDFEVDSSLLSALPNALKEDAAARSAFNQTTIDQFKAALVANLAKKEEAITAAGPEAAARKAAVTAASEAHEKAKAGEAEVSKALDALHEQEKEAKKDVNAAKKKVANYYPDMKVLMDGFDAAKEELTDFNTDILGAFGELKAREAPPPEPEADAEPAAEEGAEPAGEA